MGLISAKSSSLRKVGIRSIEGRTNTVLPMGGVDVIEHVRTLQDMSSSLLAGGMSSIHYAAPVYFVAGGICCSFSHAVAIPLDVVKTRQQTNKTMANFGIPDAVKVSDISRYEGEEAYSQFPTITLP